MSCHRIGAGLNNVANTVISLYDNQQISQDAARAIIAKCYKSVWYCDGNPYEAVECISDCRCGRCLRLVPEGELLLDVCTTPDGFQSGINAFRKHAYANDRFCETCFAEVVNECCSDAKPDTASKYRDYIIGHYGKGSYLSTGKMRPVR